MNAPKRATWIIATLIAFVAIIEEFDVVSLNLEAHTFNLMIISVVLFALATVVKGL